jgi:hypothetical protein
MHVKLMTSDTLAIELAPVHAAVADGSAQPRRNTAHGSTAAASQPGETLALAQAALYSSRQASAVSVGIISATSEIGTEPEKAAAMAAHIQAEAEALLALSLHLTRLAQAMCAAADALRPSPERQRTLLAENLQRFKAHHLGLVARAEAMLAGGAPLSSHELVSAGQCGLGQWWQAAAQAGWGSAAAFLALERPHKAFHRAVAGLLFAHQQHRALAATAYLEELRTHAVGVAENLEALCAEVLGPNGPAHGRTASQWAVTGEDSLLAGAGTWAEG